MKIFDEFIRKCELRDLDLSNANYTLVSSRIDRFFFCNSWVQCFESVRWEVVVRSCSHHYPSILDTSPVKWSSMPFDFEHMWLAHPKFKEACENW